MPPEAHRDAKASANKAKKSPKKSPIESATLLSKPEKNDDSTALVLDASNHYIVAGIFGPGLSLEHIELAPRQAFQKLHEILKKLLLEFEKKTGRKKPDWMGATLGPGSFTGLRISVGTARNLSQLWSVPVLGTDSLSFVARVFRESLAAEDRPEKLAVLLDGRQRQVYWKAFAFSARGVLADDSSVSEIRDSSPALALDLLSRHPDTMLLCVDDLSRVESYLSEEERQLWQKHKEENRIRKWPKPSARLLYEHLCALGGKTQAGSWQELLPLYVRSDPATSKYPGGFSHALGSK